MTHQMSRGSQVAFAKAWLERHGIESQTVDIYSHIDSSLSYEENIKNLKQMLGMGGRSTKKATRDLSAAECDVAIGNYNAGFDHESTREACDCGEPTACDDVMREKKTVVKTKAPPIYPPTTPKKKDYKPAKAWEDFVKINKTQISKHTAGIKKWSAGIKDKKQGEKLFKDEIRQYKIDITDIWSKTKGEVAAEPTTNPKKKTRLETQRDLIASSKIPVSTILKEVQELNPMGRRSDMGVIMGVMPRKGVPVNTAVGEIVFAKKRQPTREQLKRWEGLQKESKKMTNEATRLSFDAVGEGGTIGNKLAQKHGEELLGEGMLTTEEATYVKKARKFWKEHPHADTGVVRGEKILELNIETGGVVKAKPKAKTKVKATPKFTTTKDAEQWLETKYKEYGGRWKFQATPEYKEVHPHLLDLYGKRNRQIEKERKQVNIIKNPYGAGYSIQFEKSRNTYVGGGMMGGMATFETVDKAVKEAKRLEYEIMSKPKVATPKRKATKPKKTVAKPKPKVKKTTTTPKRKATKPKKTVAKPKPKVKKTTTTPKRKATKPKKTVAKPKPKVKKTTTTPKLTATQKKRLVAKGRITVKRDGKFITITR